MSLPQPPARHGRDDLAVVFVHGYLCLDARLYWMGLRPLRRTLEARGVRVVVSRQPRTSSVERRGDHLAGLLDALPHRELVLVGHSMGGLDARWVASRRDPRRRISHVVSVGTPHRGTRLAEWALGASALRARLARLVDRGGLRDLAPEGAMRLNGLIPDRDDVAYRSLAGALPSAGLPAFLRPLGERLEDEEGPNDGLVGTASAAWGVDSPVLAADHLSLIGLPLGPRAALAGPGRRAEAALLALNRTLAHLLPVSRPGAPR